MKSKNNNNFKGILFDMDGVIVDSMEHHADSWCTVFRELCDIELTREEIFQREGMSGMSSIIDILNERGIPAPTEEQILAIRQEKHKLFENSSIEVFPGAKQILELLKSRHIKLGLVTGSLRRSVDYLLNRTFLQFFDAVVTVDDIVQGKPHPESYQKGVEGLGMSKADVLAIENAPMGILSAKSAGLTCYAITTTLGRDHLAKADRIFATHDELYSYFKSK